MEPRSGRTIKEEEGVEKETTPVLSPPQPQASQPSQSAPQTAPASSDPSSKNPIKHFDSIEAIQLQYPRFFGDKLERHLMFTPIVSSSYGLLRHGCTNK